MTRRLIAGAVALVAFVGATLGATVLPEDPVTGWWLIASGLTLFTLTYLYITERNDP